MKLTYEQHKELLELAQYFAKVRRNTLEQGMQLDSLVTPFENTDNEEKKEHEHVYVERKGNNTNWKKNLL